MLDTEVGRGQKQRSCWVVVEEKPIGSKNDGSEGGVVMEVIQGNTTHLKLVNCFFDGIKPDLCDFNIRPLGEEIGGIPNFSSRPRKNEFVGGRCCSKIICNGKLVCKPVACGARKRSDF